MSPRAITLSVAAWLASIGAWLAIREIRWLYWRQRCGTAEVERDFWRREAVFWQREAGNHVETLRRAGL